MRKKCNFSLPKPFVVLSTNGLKRNNNVKYIIYPDLKRFKKACLNCPCIKHDNNHYRCGIDDPDFMLKFYGIDNKLPSGVCLCLGVVPPGVKPLPLRLEVEAYFNSRKKSKRARVKTINNNLVTG